ncbi:TPA: hypothetical protein CPT82_03710 [Candidatus Gastranaerophilales bacterium HUM_2]|nr:MAG TPA: hypothetical protein CPT82_03710 [Candidatus Gastranaerophilales bacterium HUM_2]
MSVLLSIKPKYVEEIEKGSKLYEFRKVIFKEPTEEIWVYSSAPIKRIVGKIYVDSIIEDSPEAIWKSCNKNAGIEKQSFFKYFEGKNKGYAIVIKKYEAFKKPINPYDENIDFVPPQSYAYLNNILPTLT